MRRLGSLCSAVSLSACVESSPPETSATARPADVLFHGHGLAELFSLKSLLVTALVIAAAFVIQQAAERLLRLFWRLGFDTERRLAAPASLLSLGLAAAVVLFIAHMIFRAAPIFAVALCLALLGAALWSSGFLADAVAGVGLILRRPLRLGDRVTLATHVGIVRAIHLTKLELKSSDGDTIVVPNRLVNQHALNIERARNTVPVVVGVELADPSEARIRMLRRSLLLSPYRAPGTAVEISSDPANTRCCRFEVQVWSARATAEARAQLQATLERTLESLRA